jgi:hypothetical protein
MKNNLFYYMKIFLHTLELLLRPQVQDCVTPVSLFDFHVVTCDIQHVINCIEIKKIIIITISTLHTKFPLTHMGVRAPRSVHARPHLHERKFGAHVWGRGRGSNPPANNEKLSDVTQKAQRER